MNIDGYLAVAKKSWLFILCGILFVTITAFGVNTWLLHNDPKFESYVDVTLMPTSHEMAFAKNVSGGRRVAQSAALVKTIREQLYSEPVINGALEISGIEDRGNSLENGQPGNSINIFTKISDSLTYCINFLKKIYKVLDAGYYNQKIKQFTILTQYRKALKVYAVDGSFILRVEVTLSDPNKSAAFANALIASYNEFSRDREHQAVEYKKMSFENKIVRNTEIISDFDKNEFELRKKLGVISAVNERTSLLKSLELERQLRSTSIVEREQLEVRLINFKSRVSSETQRAKLQEINDEVENIKSRIQELSGMVDVRANIINRLKNDIDMLAVKERPLQELQRKRDIIKQKTDSLTQAMASLEIIGSENNPAAMSVLNPAHPAPYPASPKVIRNTMLAGIVSAVLSLLIVVGIATISRTVPDNVHTLYVQKEANIRPS